MGNPVDPFLLAPLDLAYIGDSVYETVNRTESLKKGSRPVNVLHRECSGRANAVFQAEMYKLLLPDLTEKEAEVARRARNAEVYTKAKNASLADYHQATALEAVIGYLYLMGEYDRMLTLIRKGWEALGKD